MAFVNGMITTIGGGNDLKYRFGLPATGSGSYTNKLISFVEKADSGKWTEVLQVVRSEREW